MTIHYNTTGDERKRLADYIAGFLGSDKEYLGAPTFAYQIGYITVSKDGDVTIDDRADSKEVETLLEELETEGFHAASAAPDAAAVDNAAEQEMPPQEADTGLTVAMPRELFTDTALENLTRLLDAKGSLIKKALAIDALPVEVGADTVSFPWFSKMPDGDEVKAYTHLITALCEMSKNQKRITAKEKAVDNEKYAFRCFLLRLGFIGTEFKTERKILLSNLSGSSAFKSTAHTAAE